MSNTARLLIVDHGVKLNGDAYKRLAEAGYVVIRGDPRQFHVVEAVPLVPPTAGRAVNGQLLFDAAIASISEATYDEVRTRFVKKMLRALTAPPVPPAASAVPNAAARAASPETEP